MLRFLLGVLRFFLMLGLAFGLVLAAAAAYLFFTPLGARLLGAIAFSKSPASSLIPRPAFPGGHSAGGQPSAASSGWDLGKLIPDASVIKAQNIALSMVNGEPVVQIDNGRLMMPDSEPVVFYGSYGPSGTSIRLYTKSLGIEELSGLIPQLKFLRRATGSISDADISVSGTLDQPTFTGHFHIDRAFRRGIRLENCPASLALTLRRPPTGAPVELYGEVGVRGGMAEARGITFQLQTSRFIFTGDPKNPELAIRGTTTVANVKVNVALEGTPAVPELRPTSDPPLPQGELLMMLATGRSWQGAEQALSTGQLSPDLVRDFVDYVFFGGLGNKFTHWLGITQFSVTYNEETKAVEVQKTVPLIDRMTVGYGVEQPQQGETAGPETRPATTHKISAEYRVTPDTAVEVEGAREVVGLQTPVTDATQTAEPPKESVFLKIKKRF